MQVRLWAWPGEWAFGFTLSRRYIQILGFHRTLEIRFPYRDE